MKALRAAWAIAGLVMGCGVQSIDVYRDGEQEQPPAPAPAPSPQPKQELCGNGLDDDGDGQVDEDCTCTQGASRSCYSGDPALLGVGVCRAGTQSCALGGELLTWGLCQGELLPSAEVCNGLDDDCDGLIDEDLRRACSSACGPGEEVCSAGAWGACSAPQPGAELCGNGVDDDCDGQVDETCSVCIKSPSQTPWQLHSGEAPFCWGQVFPTHGDPAEYAFSTIPAEGHPGWVAHAAPAISFDDRSTMCGVNGAPDVCTCRGGGDFTYFQTSFDIPAGYTVSSLVVTIADVDDGVRVSLFNSAHPNGVVSPGSYAFLGGGSTTNLAAFVVPGKNRVVLTHVDDCCQVRRIANATISLNGSAVNPCP